MTLLFSEERDPFSKTVCKFSVYDDGDVFVEDAGTPQC